MCTFILQADMLSRKAPYTTLYVHLFSHMSVVLKKLQLLIIAKSMTLHIS